MLERWVAVLCGVVGVDRSRGLSCGLPLAAVFGCFAGAGEGGGADYA